MLFPFPPIHPHASGVDDDASLAFNIPHSHGTTLSEQRWVTSHERRRPLVSLPSNCSELMARKSHSGSRYKAGILRFLHFRGIEQRRGRISQGNC